MCVCGCMHLAAISCVLARRSLSPCAVWGAVPEILVSSPKSSLHLFLGSLHCILLPHGILLLGSRDPLSTRLHPTPPPPIPQLGLELGVVSVAIDGTGQYGAASSMDSTINVWSQADYSSAARFKLPPAEAWSVAWLPPPSDGRLTLAVAGGSSNTVSLLDVSAQLAGGEAPRPVTLHMPPPPAAGAAGAAPAQPFVLSVAASPDGRLVAAGAMDGGVALFDTATGRLLSSLAGHAKAVRGLAFTPDSRHLLTACDDLHANLYDVGQAALVESFAAHESWVLSVAVHPDGSAAITGSSDAKVRLWDLGTRTLAQTVADAHADQVWSVAFRGDGARVASASDDHSVCVFDFQ